MKPVMKIGEVGPEDLCEFWTNKAKFLDRSTGGTKPGPTATYADPPSEAEWDEAAVSDADDDAGSAAGAEALAAEDDHQPQTQTYTPDMHKHREAQA